MKKDNTIVVTGAAGFIGSCLVGFLNEKGYTKLILVDDFSEPEKMQNLEGKQFVSQIERESFFDWLEQMTPEIDFVFHIGARTDTTEFNYAIHEHLNVQYSQKVWNYCVAHNVPMVYASSAATYGNGEHGYNDDHAVVYSLQPLNPYGVSKNEFDKWALQQTDQPPFWAGLKFFNVYGPNEYHKGRMASVIWHSFKQINENGKVKLFKSHKEGYKDGQQLRDFVYVKDLLKICTWLMDQCSKDNEQIAVGNANWTNGLYNLGTGKARSFADLATSTFRGLDKEPVIDYIDMPEDIRDKYQYFTEANMQKLRDAGYKDEFYSLEDGVNDYVRNYLAAGKYY